MRKCSWIGDKREPMMNVVTTAVYSYHLNVFDFGNKNISTTVFQRGVQLLQVHTNIRYQRVQISGKDRWNYQDQTNSL